MFRVIIVAGLLFWNTAAPAGDAGDTGAEIEIREATAAWVAAFNARDAQRIAALYAPDAVFWGTVSPTIRITPDQVLEYFDASVARSPNMRIGIHEQHVRLYGNTATSSGVYITRNPQQGAGDLLRVSRFTFVYQRREGQWVVVAHHSSRMPTP